MSTILKSTASRQVPPQRVDAVLGHAVQQARNLSEQFFLANPRSKFGLFFGELKIALMKLERGSALSTFELVQLANCAANAHANEKTESKAEREGAFVG